MKRYALIIVTMVLAASTAMAADVRVKRLDNGGDSNSDGVGQGIGHDQGTVRSRPMSPVQNSESDRGHGNRSDWHRNDRSVGHGQNLQQRSSSISIGAGRTRIVRQSTTPAPESHGAIAGNRTIIKEISRDRRVEVVPNHQYWHNDGGRRWVHTYRGGVHWYGFYQGPRFYWTRYYNDRWWWYDVGFNHWVFWSNGRWWWNGPGGVLYVYVDNSYYPYDAAPVALATPAPGLRPAEETENNGGEWTSLDGERMVQINGPMAEAFLYDKSSGEARYLAYLGKHVERVRFSGGTDGRPVRILVDYKNGDFTLFSSEGEPVDLTPPDEPTTAAGEPPTPPTDIPK